MTKKRKSGGSRSSDQGRQTLVPCSNCGRLTPRGKGKKITRYVSLVDAQIGKELRDQGAIMPREKITEFLCVSCAIHSHAIRIRSTDERKKHERF